ncbi:MAG: FtsB family cell division protein [Acidimicrobiales bacterium]
MRRAVRLLLVGVAVAGIVFLFVLPARTWLEQGSSMSAAQRRVAALSKENAALQQRVAQLHSTAYIEQVARQQYGLVMPGEKAYSILPPAASTTVAPAHHAHHKSFWESLEFWK